jgi:hypothetical protein
MMKTTVQITRLDVDHFAVRVELGNGEEGVSEVNALWVREHDITVGEQLTLYHTLDATEIIEHAQAV